MIRLQIQQRWLLFETQIECRQGFAFLHGLVRIDCKDTTPAANRRIGWLSGISLPGRKGPLVLCRKSVFFSDNSFSFIFMNLSCWWTVLSSWTYSRSSQEYWILTIINMKSLILHVFSNTSFLWIASESVHRLYISPIMFQILYVTAMSGDIDWVYLHAPPVDNEEFWGNFTTNCTNQLDCWISECRREIDKSWS